MLRLLVGCVFAFGSSAFAGDSDLVKSYAANGKIVMDAIVAKKVSLDVVEKPLKAMSEDAAKLATSYGAKFPEGAKLLKMTVDALPKLQKASFTELEKEWHDLAHFSKPGNNPGIDLKSEKNEHFTDPLHCIVHPLMTLRAAEAYAKGKADKDLQAMKEELSEGLEQMEILGKKLK